LIQIVVYMDVCSSMTGVKVIVILIVLESREEEEEKLSW